MPEQLPNAELESSFLKGSGQVLEQSGSPISTGALVENGEKLSALCELPRGDKLKEIYELELGLTEPSSLVRFPHNDEVEYPDIYLPSSAVDEHGKIKLSTSEIHQLYVKKAAKDATKNSWWNIVDHYAAEKGQELKLAASHKATIKVDSRPVDQGFEVFEFGESVQDEQTLRTVFDTLTLIDQFSGGLLAADPDSPRVVLVDGMKMENNGRGRETLGFAHPNAVVINMRAIAERATESGVKPDELMAVVLVHEILGHSLEHAVEGEDGKFFKGYFDYSEDKVEGNRYEAVHASIKPKEEGRTGSAPVREYGRVNSAEDMATSVDSVVADAMDLKDSMNKIESMRSMPDAYRRDLILELMNKAAQQAAGYEGTPGAVGSELRYEYDENGKAINTRAARTMEISTISGEQAVAEEIQKVVAKYQPPKVLVVGVVAKI